MMNGKVRNKKYFFVYALLIILVDLIDNLHELDKVHGPISKVDLIQSHDGNQWLNFII
jgi:hypothetical protein